MPALFMHTPEACKVAGRHVHVRARGVALPPGQAAGTMSRPALTAHLMQSEAQAPQQQFVPYRARVGRVLHSEALCAEATKEGGPALFMCTPGVYKMMPAQ